MHVTDCPSCWYLRQHRDILMGQEMRDETLLQVLTARHHRLQHGTVKMGTGRKASHPTLRCTPHPHSPPAPQGIDRGATPSWSLPQCPLPWSSPLDTTLTSPNTASEPQRIFLVFCVKPWERDRRLGLCHNQHSLGSPARRAAPSHASLPAHWAHLGS